LSRGREYDEAITIFSPEGRIYQVEYALELVKRGAPVAGVVTKEGVVLAAVEVLRSSLEDPRFSKKIYELDDHVATAISGNSPDARVLVREARLVCQGHRLTYDEPIGIESLTSSLGDLLQQYTQNAGVRPFGVSMIISGIDVTGCRMLSIDPSGSYRGYKATALGMNNEKARELLEKKYREDMKLDEAIRLSVEAIRTAYQNELKAENINISVITAASKVFKKLEDEEIKKYL
jgi:proteasome alpha subunit